MTVLRVLLSRLSGLFRRGSLESDLDDELGFHLQMEIDENMRRGMTEKKLDRHRCVALGVWPE